MIGSTFDYRLKDLLIVDSVIRKFNRKRNPQHLRAAKDLSDLHILNKLKTRKSQAYQTPLPTAVQRQRPPTSS